MKPAILCLIMLLNFVPCFGQDTTKEIVGIIPFSYEDASYKKQAEQLQNIVTRIFNANSRISLLDRSKVAAIQKELDLQKGKEYINGKTVKQHKAFGAQYIIIGNLTNIEVEKSMFSGINPFNNGKASTTTTSKCRVIFTLQKIDVTTGELNATKVFEVSSNGAIETENFKKDVNPVKNAIEINAKKINEEVRNWVGRLFPPKLRFLGLEEKDKKGVPKYVTLLSQNENHIQEGDLISILEIQDIPDAGVVKHRKIEVATLKVKLLQGDVLKCTILMGAKAIEENTSGKLRLEIVQKEN